MHWRSVKNLGFRALKTNKTSMSRALGGGVFEWLTRWTNKLRITSRMGSKQVSQGQAYVSLSKKLYIHCSVLVGSRSECENVSIS